MARLAGSLIAIITLAIMVGIVVAHTLAREKAAGDGESVAMAPPDSIAVRRHRLLNALEQTSHCGGETGPAAEHARGLLVAHFAKEESLALPALGALEPLTRGELPEEAQERVIRLSSDLQEELPVMVEEHRQILGALQHLHDVARTEDREEAANLARDISEYARSEEEVLYPAAILAGEYLRIKGGA